MNQPLKFNTLVAYLRISRIVFHFYKPPLGKNVSIFGRPLYLRNVFKSEIKHLVYDGSKSESITKIKITMPDTVALSKRILSSFLLKRNICSIQWILILLYLFVVTVQSSLGIILFGLKSVPKKNPLWRWVLILLWRHEERKRERSPTRDNTLYQLPLSYVFSHQGYDRSRPPTNLKQSFAPERNRDRYWRNPL